MTERQHGHSSDDQQPEPPPVKKRKVTPTVTMIGIQEDMTLKVQVQKNNRTQNMYEHVETNHIPVKMQTCDPQCINPNSYERVRDVLHHIGRVVAIDRYVPVSLRKWCMVVCDGLPYTLALKVIKETLVCHSCWESFFTKEVLSKHQEEIHPGQINLTHEREFDWVLLKIGLGHVEMNLARSYLELNWEVFLSEVAWTMGFRSENAQHYARKGSNHHKTWELLRVTYLGSIDELLVPYVRECLSQNRTPSVTDYLERWCSASLSPNYEHFRIQIMTFLHAIMVFRGGVRCNNSSYITSGMKFFAPVLHGRNHPKYQTIELVEAANVILAPREVANFISNFQSVSYTGDPYRHEGMDFQLERYNKSSKAWLPKGVPSRDDWMRVFRLLDRLDGVRHCTERLLMLERYQIPDEGTTHEPEELTVTAWRVHLRQSGYLTNPNVVEQFHTSMKGVELDPELVAIVENASHKRQHHMRCLFPSNYTMPSVQNVPLPVFVTAEERDNFHKVENKSMDTIKLLVPELIDQLDSDFMQAHFLNTWKKVKNKNKVDLIQFYYKVKEEVVDQTPLAQLV